MDNNIQPLQIKPTTSAQQKQPGSKHAMDFESLLITDGGLPLAHGNTQHDQGHLTDSRKRQNAAFAPTAINLAVVNLIPAKVPTSPENPAMIATSYNQESSSFNMVPNVEITQAEDSKKSVSQQVQISIFPLSAVANGYLSQLATFTTAEPTIEAAKPGAIVLPQPTPNEIAKVDLRLGDNKFVSAGITTPQFYSGVPAYSTDKHIKVERLLKTPANIPNSIDVKPRNWSMTAEQSGRSFWYRDFFMTLGDELSFISGLDKSEFIADNGITTVYLNGKTVWEKVKEKYHD